MIGPETPIQTVKFDVFAHGGTCRVNDPAFFFSGIANREVENS